MSEASQLGRFIRDCRTRLKYTSRKVAALTLGREDLSPISGSYLVSIENGQHIPRLDKVISLSEIFGVPVHHFVEHCRRDMAVVSEPEAGVGFDELMEAGQECRAAGDPLRALGYFRQGMLLLNRDQNPKETTANPDSAARAALELAAC